MLVVQKCFLVISNYYGNLNKINFINSTFNKIISNINN